METYRCILLGPPFPLMGKGRDRGAREPIRPITPTFVLPRQRLCRNDENAAFVILNEVKNLMHSIRYTTQILRRPPQNDIATQPLKGKEGIRALPPVGCFISRPLAQPQTQFSKESTGGHEGFEKLLLRPSCPSRPPSW
jgi:hypothetical protein